MAYYKCGKIFATQNSNTSIETASGAIANFRTSLAIPVLGCIAEFSASQASGTPTPSTPVPIVGVDKVLITDCGKNMFDKTAIESDKILAWATGYYANEEGSYVSGFIPVKAGASYIFSNVPVSQCLGYDKNKNYIKVYKGDSGTWDEPSSGGTFRNPITIPEGVCFIRISRRKNQMGEATIEQDSATMQMEEGSTVTTYNAYTGSTTALINLGGTYYGGEVDAVTGKITLTRKIVDMGDLSWSYVSANNLFSSNVIADMEVLPWNTELQGKFLCECGKPKAPNTAWSNLVDYEYGTLNGAIRFKDSNFTDPALFKANISGNKIMYPLATPIVVYASNTAEILTIVGDNQVFADTGDIEVKYRKLHSDN